ncbi:MAG: nucleotidyl transferase AbiEii/AbiGii toxin family protein [Patescibacteria group bacterium]
MNQNQHKQILISILKQIYSNPVTQGTLGFKGGTAALLFYGLPRMSVDLDFDLLDPTKEDLIFEYLTKALPKFGEMREQYKKRYTLFFLIRYLVGARNVKIEISRRAAPSQYELKNYLGIPMLVMTKEDMLANKLVALIDRAKPVARDFFDTWYFLKEGWQINFDLVKDRTGLKPDQYFEKAIQIIEDQKPTFFLHGLGELLEAPQKDWVRQKLKEEVLFRLRLAQETQSLAK